MDFDTFQSKIHVMLSSSFPIERTDFLTKKLRLEIYLFLITRKSEDEYFDINSSLFSKEIINKVLEELEGVGWKYALSFGDTGLFIFKDQKPKTCW